MIEIGPVQLLAVGFGSGAKVEGKLADELAKLCEDIITEDDFEAKKKQLLKI